MHSQDFNNRYNEAKRALFDKYYSGLNREQKQAVYHVNGPLLILAGAGSGKTTVLVNRLVYLIKYGDAYNTSFVPEDATEDTVEDMKNAMSLPREELGEYLLHFRVNAPAPWSVMAITFTNKAAGEIKERIRNAFEDEEASNGIWSGTFHSICLRFLRRWHEEAGYSDGFGITDTDDTKKLITECMKELKIDTKQFPVKRIMNTISSMKDKLMTPADAKEDAGDDVFKKVSANVYGLYQKKLIEANMVDFDDIIMQTVMLFNDRPDILEKVQNRFRYVSVDEYQDTNEAQFRLVTQISGGYKNIMAVGDDDQSIYKFRGATIKNILNFDLVYPDATVIKLEQNYRSTKTILDAANAIIKNNSQRKGKNLWTAGDEGDKIEVRRVETQLDEARFISDTVTMGILRDKNEYRDYAVLYRTNAQSRSIEQAFAKAGVPYRMLGSLRFFDRAEIKDVLAYVCVINNPRDSIHLKRIINVPRRGIGAKSIEAAEILAASSGKSLLEVMRNAFQYTAIPSSAAKSMAELAELIDGFAKGGCSVSEIIEGVADKSGYMGMLIRGGEEEKERIENIGELISTAKQYEADSDNPTLSEFLEDVALVSDVDRYDEGANAVVLMTIHSAKGLEFPVVFLPGMEEGLFPGYQTVMNPAEIEEERRLAYVAVTRAKKKLYITHTYNRMINGSTQYNPPSRFIEEIPSELCDTTDVHKGRQSYTFGSGASSYGGGNSYRNGNPNAGRSTGNSNTRSNHITVGTGTAKPFSAVSPSGGALKVFGKGDRVKHSTFGAGTVVSVKNMGGDMLYEINFDKIGVKKLMATYARLTEE